MAQGIQSQREAEAYEQLVSKVEEDYDEVIDEYATVYLVATGGARLAVGGGAAGNSGPQVSSLPTCPSHHGTMACR
jgi:hypothetical protein